MEVCLAGINYFHSRHLKSLPLEKYVQNFTSCTANVLLNLFHRKQEEMPGLKLFGIKTKFLYSKVEEKDTLK